jgi:predicted nucleic acid-binding protein
MTGLVIDASVVIKLLIDEEHSDRALKLLSDAVQTGASLFAPTLMPSEVTNVLFQRTRRQQHAISESVADEALAMFLHLPIHLEAPPDLYPRALHFARVSGQRATYDCVYVALAELLGVELWTADEKLVRSVGPATPWVRWIGDYPITSGTG